MESVEKPLFASVILDLAIDKTLDYHVPHHLAPLVKKGLQVKVPIRGSFHTGYIFALKEQTQLTKTLPIEEILHEDELISEDLFELALWMAKYYCTPLSKVLKVMLPASVRQNMGHKEQFAVMRAKTKELLREECVKMQERHPAQARVLEVMLQVKKEILLTELLEKANVSKSPVETLVKNGLLELTLLRLHRSPLLGEYFKTAPKVLNEEQKKALDKVTSSLERDAFETHLIHGVTGSGKTEIYLQAIEKALEMKKGTIMLVPEIALTAQTIERFRSRFDEKIAVLHHRLSHGERCDEWHRIRTKEAQIVVGARSALFSPVPNLGLIIVDEEHDSAYKQGEEMPCYHARDVAVVRGKISKATVILGSATPSLESYYNVERGKYHLSTLQNRIANAPLACVTIVDMKKEYEKQRGFTSFSAPLIEGIKKRISLGEQTILFLNRRGYNTSLHCTACSFIAKCSSCDLPLTFHLNENILSCHCCGFRLNPPRSCPECKHPETMKYRGVGTEQIERSLHALFPDIRALRIDQDSTRHKGSHENFLRQFATGKSDVLIGTQMISKGLHFPNVTLVAILNSDAPLHIPDFRASEHVFGLITQVAGRSGRGALSGEVIIQTQMPENPIIQLAAKQDYEGFYKQEIETRKIFTYPPYTHIVKFLFTGLDPVQVKESALQARAKLVPKLSKEVAIHPVLPAGHPKIKDHFRFQFLVRTHQVYPVVGEVGMVQEGVPRGVKLLVDVDPTNTFF